MNNVNTSGNAHISLLVSVLVLGMGVFLWIVLGGVLGGRPDFFELEAPGEMEVMLSQVGSYTVFHEYFRTQDSQETVRPKGVDGLEVMLMPTGGGATVAVSPAEDAQPYAIRRRLRETLYRIEITTPGTYAFKAAYPETDPGPPVRLVISQTYERQVFGAFIKGIGVLLITAILVTIIAIKKPRQST